MSTGSTADDRALLLHAAVVADLLDGQLEQRLSPTRLAPREFEVATVLTSRGPLTPGEIATVTGVPAPSVSRVTSRMEEAELLAHRPHPSDGRSRIVELTDDGRTAYHEAQSVFQELFDAVATALGTQLPVVDFGVRRLEWALRVVAGIPIPAPLPSAEGISQALHYPGQRLSLADESEVLDYIEWVRARGATRTRS